MICSRCGEEKAQDAFPRNKNRKSGYESICKPCKSSRNWTRIKERYGNSRHYHLRQRFGVGEAEVERMLLQQGGKFAVCKERSAKHVDHDHRTKKVRGILCFNCNRGLGYFNDDIVRMCMAADYLEGVTADKEWDS